MTTIQPSRFSAPPSWLAPFVLLLAGTSAAALLGEPQVSPSTGVPQGPVYLDFSTRTTGGAPLVGSKVVIRGAGVPAVMLGNGGGNVELQGSGTDIWHAVVSAPSHVSRLENIEVGSLLAQNGYGFYDTTLPALVQAGPVLNAGSEPVGADGLVHLEAFPRIRVADASTPHRVEITYPPNAISAAYRVLVAAAGAWDFDPAGPGSLGIQVDRIPGEVHVSFQRWSPGSANHLEVIDTSSMPAPGCSLRFKPMHSSAMYLEEQLALYALATDTGVNLGQVWRYHEGALTWGPQSQSSIEYDGETGEFVLRSPGFSGYSCQLRNDDEVLAMLIALGMIVEPQPETTPEIEPFDLLECEWTGDGNIQCGTWAGPSTVIAEGSKVEKQITMELTSSVQASLGLSTQGIASLVSKIEASADIDVGGSLTGTYSKKRRSPRPWDSRMARKLRLIPAWVGPQYFMRYSRSENSRWQGLPWRLSEI